MLKRLQAVVAACGVLAGCASVQAQTLVPGNFNRASINANRNVAGQHKQGLHKVKAKIVHDEKQVVADAEKLKADKAAGNQAQVKVDKAQLKSDAQVLRADRQWLSRHRRGGANPQRNMQPMLRQPLNPAGGAGVLRPSAILPAQS